VTTVVRGLRPAGGQASVELVGVLPLVVMLVLVVGQLLAAGAAAEMAGGAAEAGAVALVQGGDPAAAAKSAVPDWSRGRMTVVVEDTRVRVVVRPRAIVPPLVSLLTARASADAGPKRWFQHLLHAEGASPRRQPPGDHLPMPQASAARPRAAWHPRTRPPQRTDDPETTSEEA
jgi:hypothetical protein